MFKVDNLFLIYSSIKQIAWFARALRFTCWYFSHNCHINVLHCTQNKNLFLLNYIMINVLMCCIYLVYSFSWKKRSLLKANRFYFSSFKNNSIRRWLFDLSGYKSRHWSFLSFPPLFPIRPSHVLLPSLVFQYLGWWIHSTDSFLPLALTSNANHLSYAASINVWLQSHCVFFFFFFFIRRSSRPELKLEIPVCFREKSYWTLSWFELPIFNKAHFALHFHGE